MIENQVLQKTNLTKLGKTLQKILEIENKIKILEEKVDKTFERLIKIS
jgi:uncharacterized protein Yka (UPF0111/DUF47 family)